LCFICTLLPGARTVVTFHSGGYASSPAGRRAGRRGVRAIVFRRVDRIIAVNAEIASFFRRLGVSAERIAVILPHAVDTSVANDPSVPLPPAIASFAASCSPVFVTVGLLEPEYDLESQLEVLDRVRRVHPNAGLVIVGSGSLHGSLRGAIDASASRSRILLCGDVAHEETLRLIARADVLLRTTRYDGDSVAVREALALGTPVVASDNRMRPPGVHLYPVGDVNALEQAIETALAAGRRPSGGDADARNIDAVLDVYRALVGESRARPLNVARAE
jgi:glycosyltransferase involved in cell wall biosynthesis